MGSSTAVLRPGLGRAGTLTALLSGPLLNGDAYPLERGDGAATAGARLNGRLVGTGDGFGRIGGVEVAPSAADDAGEHDSEGD